MRLLIVFNPAAGNAIAQEQDISIAANLWRERGWLVTLQPTQRSGDATRIARKAAEEGYDVVVAAGGDGTINEVVNGLVGTETALATLPVGTMNVWARELKLPLHARAAAASLDNAVVRTIDLGRAGDRYFLMMAGIGFDATITEQVQPEEKRRFGPFAYILRGVGLIGRMRGTQARIILDGREMTSRVLWVVVGNSQLYGGVVKVTHRASVDDGLLDVCVIKGDHLYTAPWHMLSLLLRRHSLDTEIEYYRARRVEIQTRHALPVQVDGDAIGHTPMTFEIVPGALRALMPVQVTEGLVQGDLVQSPVRSARSLYRLVIWLFRHVPLLRPRTPAKPVLTPRKDAEAHVKAKG